VLDVRVEAIGPGEARINVSGELDLAGAGELRGVVTDLINAGTTKIIGLDLRELAFIDSTGIGTLVVALRICGQVGVEFSLVGVSPFVAHVLTVAGVHEALGVPGAVAATVRTSRRSVRGPLVTPRHSSTDERRGQQARG
jgi:anti-anti-sigma factor